MNTQQIDAFFEKMDKADLAEAKWIRQAFYENSGSFSEEARRYLDQRLRERTQRLVDELRETEQEAESYFEKRRQAMA